LLGILLVCGSSAGLPPRHFVASPVSSTALRLNPGVNNCTERFFNQQVDHFSAAIPPGRPDGTYAQRYFTCLEDGWTPGDPVFFYCGNEANVELYVNASGLMWESAPGMKAKLVFAEHRYFGQSQLYGYKQNLQFLSSEQALADFATLISHLKGEWKAEHSPVIGFGGSYGGMLASWLRLKYPATIVGAIAGSAPILSFMGQTPAYDSGSFAKIVTLDASVEGGSPQACAPNVRASWPLIFELGKNQTGQDELNRIFKLCDNSKIGSSSAAYGLASWLQSSFDYMSMGSYPYPSSYILNGKGLLPAYPMRQACKALATPLDGESLLRGMMQAASVFYNATGNQKCFNLHASANNETTMDGQYWNYLYCAELLQPFSRDGVSDMFYSQPFDEAGASSQCQREWNVTAVRSGWAHTNFGGLAALQASSNLVFSNGGLDPWRGGGVTQNVSSSVVAVVIPGVGHHMDLMFSDPRDPPAVVAARDFERQSIRSWIQEYRLLIKE